MVEAGMLEMGKFGGHLAKTLQRHMPDSWHSLLKRRLETLIPDGQLLEAMTAIPKLDQEFAQLCRISAYTPGVAMIVIKTWSDSWTTSERFHENETLPCIFGCGGRDNLRHYLECEHLWTPVNCCTGASSREWRYSVAEKLGMVNPCLRKLRRLAVAFGCYHSCRFNHRSEIDQARRTGDFSSIIMLLFASARAHALEHALLH